MSVVPLIFRDWWDDFDRPVSRLMDQHFGRGLDRDDLISRFSDLSLNRPLRSILGNSYYRPWRNVTRQHSTGSSTVQIDNKDNFQVGDSIVFKRKLRDVDREKDLSLRCSWFFDFGPNSKLAKLRDGIFWDQKHMDSQRSKSRLFRHWSFAVSVDIVALDTKWFRNVCHGDSDVVLLFWVYCEKLLRYLKNREPYP